MNDLGIKRNTGNQDDSVMKVINIQVHVEDELKFDQERVASIIVTYENGNIVRVDNHPFNERDRPISGIGMSALVMGLVKFVEENKVK
jgi:hypothetical protein